MAAAALAKSSAAPKSSSQCGVAGCVMIKERQLIQTNTPSQIKTDCTNSLHKLYLPVFCLLSREKRDILLNSFESGLWKLSFYMGWVVSFCFTTWLPLR